MIMTEETLRHIIFPSVSGEILNSTVLYKWRRVFLKKKQNERIKNCIFTHTTLCLHGIENNEKCLSETIHNPHTVGTQHLKINLRNGFGCLSFQSKYIRFHFSTAHLSMLFVDSLKIQMLINTRKIIFIWKRLAKTGRELTKKTKDNTGKLVLQNEKNSH